MDKYTSLLELLKSDRSIRRFRADVPVSQSTLRKLVDLTRYCASGRNLQPLKYRLVFSPQECSLVYPLLKWAGYYTDWDGPDSTRRPTAYLIQCLDTSLTHNCMCDDGLQLQAITLGATAIGLGACIIKSFNAPILKKSLGLSDGLDPLYVIALGVADEITKVVPVTNGDIKYYRNEKDEQCVPKRSLDELII